MPAAFFVVLIQHRLELALLFRNGYHAGMPEYLIEPRREKGEPELPPNCLLLPNPPEAAAAAKLALGMGGRRFFLFNSSLILVPAQGKQCAFAVAGPAVGAPMAALTLEKIIALGSRRIISYGWCGSLSTNLQVADLLVPTWALRGEGTSVYYPQPSPPESAPLLRDFLIAALQDTGFRPATGPVWTTDAPFRESRQQIADCQRRGILGVDMEFSALCTVAAFRQVDYAAVMIISDELGNRQWQPGFRTKKFKQSDQEFLAALFNICKKDTSLKPGKHHGPGNPL